MLQLEKEAKLEEAKRLARIKREENGEDPNDESKIEEQDKSKDPAAAEDGA